MDRAKTFGFTPSNGVEDVAPYIPSRSELKDLLEQHKEMEMERSKDLGIMRAHMHDLRQSDNLFIFEFCRKKKRKIWIKSNKFEKKTIKLYEIEKNSGENK